MEWLIDIENGAKDILLEQGADLPCEQAEFVSERVMLESGARSINWHCACHGWHVREKTI